MNYSVVKEKSGVEAVDSNNPSTKMAQDGFTLTTGTELKKEGMHKGKLHLVILTGPYAKRHILVSPNVKWLKKS